MADDMLDIDLSEEGQEQSAVEKRIKNLSEKVKLTSQERDELSKAKQALEQEKLNIAKERDFFKGFSTMASKYNEASNFQDKIMEKVMAGYDVEDATVAILAREGKLTSPATPPPPKESPAGGSAPTTMKSGGEKTLGEMTRDEKRAALMEAADKGELSLS